MGGAGTEGGGGLSANATQTVEVPFGTCDAYVDECTDFQIESDHAEIYGGVALDRLTQVEIAVRRKCTFIDGCWLKNHAFSSVLAEMNPKEAHNA